MEGGPQLQEKNSEASIIISDPLQDFSLTEQDFSYWRKDCYENTHLVSDEYIRIVSPEEDFSDAVKHHVAYAVNLSALQDSEVNVPEFETGVRIQEEAMPYTVMERPEGRPLSDFDDLIDEDDWWERFDEMNSEGKRLSSSNRIIYPRYRENEDVIVDIDNEELVYVNPGTYVESAFYTQFSRSNVVPSDRNELGNWLSESFWTAQLEN
ncbi:hypothetical protein ACK3SF_01945 [Candidatus Nanosalina sp. VS9-1]|uniref:hypothetical protein n=1 Tax=Candidatus Nanosalina sp. VS9-1 TaxID=3388566 RepID=UPI0039E021C9